MKLNKKQLTEVRAYIARDKKIKALQSEQAMSNERLKDQLSNGVYLGPAGEVLEINRQYRTYADIAALKRDKLFQKYSRRIGCRTLTAYKAGKK